MRKCTFSVVVAARRKLTRSTLIEDNNRSDRSCVLELLAFDIL